MNIVANILGLGNASTPLGLKAMDSMQKTNKDKSKFIHLFLLSINNTINNDNAKATIRFSFGKNNSYEEIDKAISVRNSVFFII